MSRRSKQTFIQRRHTDGQEVHEKMLDIPNREMQIKTTMRYHVIPVIMVTIKKFTNNKAGEDVQKREHSYTVSGDVSW